jgi:DNA-binding NarL/FixJ family response regulator
LAQIAEPIVGREPELDTLDRLLEETCAGEHRFAVLVGEPGIGKTCLLTGLGERAAARGCLVLEGRASELERELPFGLVVDAFDAYLEALDPRTYDRLAADGLGELASVFPSLRSLGAGSEQPRTAVERFRAHHAVRELMERLAARQPLVLALDDVHWSDGASIELIGHLLRRPIQAAVLVVAAFRTGQADPRLAGAIEVGAREGKVEQLRLGPLAPADVERLLDMDGAAERDRLYRESGGNPFYLIQLARSGQTTPRIARGREDSHGVPAGVTAAIATELDGLAPSAKAFAQAAAVAGDPFELDLAVATAAMPEPEALAALDGLIARDLIRVGEVPRRFEFRHPLVRMAVYESCSPGVRLAAHERAAGALAQRGAPATARAHHVEQSARHGDMAAVAVLREAGEIAAERAPSSAARWFHAALRILPETAPPEERGRLLMALAGSWAAIGRLEDSRAALLETLELIPAGDSATRVKLISSCAAVEQLLGRHAEAHDRLAGALAELPGDDSAEAAALMFDLALDAFYGMDYEGMREWGRRALAAAKGVDDPPQTAAAAAITAFAETLEPGMTSQAQAHRNEAAALVDSLTDEELGRQLNSVAWLSATEFYLDLYGPGIAHAERGLAVAKSTGQGDLFPALTLALANLLFCSGRPREAAELLDGVVESARLSDNAVGLAWSLLNRSFAAICAGETEEALRAGEEAANLTEGFGDSPVRAWAAAANGIALRDSGAAESARRLMVDACGGDELTRIPGAWRANWLEIMTDICLATGREDDARRIAGLAGELARGYGLPLSTALAERAAARVALADGAPAAAAEHALRSASGTEEMGARIEAAASRALAGQALAALGDTERAVAELELAAQEFEACGAPRRRERVERDLRKLGRGTHRRSQPGKADAKGVGSLTGRELEIARLVVDRRTNSEIAAELFLSIKTVETHMRNIFRKLDAGSRIDVARIVEREEATR